VSPANFCKRTVSAKCKLAMFVESFPTRLSTNVIPQCILASSRDPLIRHVLLSCTQLFTSEINQIITVVGLSDGIGEIIKNICVNGPLPPYNFVVSLIIYFHTRNPV